jgi:hypothetical protein
VLCDIVGCDEGQSVRLESFEVFVVEDFDRGVFDGSVHSLCLAVAQGMIALGQPVLDPMFDADAIEEVRAEETPAGAFAILGQIGEGHTVVSTAGGACRWPLPSAAWRSHAAGGNGAGRSGHASQFMEPNISGKTP